MEKENIYAGMGTSEFDYRGIDIVVNQEGMFFFKFDGFRYEKPSLKEAKAEIDKLANRYYTVNRNFCNNVCQKLEGKERQFVNDLIKAMAEMQEDDDNCIPYDFEWIIKEK